MQECFLYCALYPEDYPIDRDNLISRFIMEGMVKGNSREEEFNQGHTLLNKLVKCCLLEEPFGEAVKMHDLVREMALQITNVKPRYMVRAGIEAQVPEEQDWAFDLDRVSFYNSKIKEIPEDMAPNSPTLSTLLLTSCSLRSIPGPFFQYMNNLQVLDLSYNSELMDLPSCISNLGSLRAFLLGGCRQLKSVPPLGKLKNLRALDVSHTDIKELPQGMENLVKLKSLAMNGIDLDELPKEILPKLSKLQYLNLPLLMNVRVEDLASLELLEEYGGGFCDLHNFHKFMRNRSNYEKDWWYDIFVGKHMPVAYDRKSKHRRVTLSLEAGGGEAPTSIILPHCIQNLYIIRCNGLSSCLVDNFLLRTTLRGLTCEISYCGNIEWIVNVPSGRNTATEPHWLCFRSLRVHCLLNLVGLCKGKIASHAFSGLTELEIEGCHKMKKLVPRAILQDLKNLEKLDVRDCYEMEEIIGREEAEGSSQSSNPQITSTTSDILILPKLKQLYLSFLPKLKRICEGKLMCDSLESMRFLKCPNLKRLPFYNPTTNEHPFPSLKIVRVEKRWERLEWDQPHIKTLFQPYLFVDQYYDDEDDDDGYDDDDDSDDDNGGGSCGDVDDSDDDNGGDGGDDDNDD